MEEEIIDSETCEIKEIQSEMVKSLEIEETMKRGKKKDKKKRKKDKGTIAVETSCEIEERNDQQNDLKRARNSNKEKTCKESLPEAQGTKDKGKKKCRKDKGSRSLDVESVENEIKKEGKEKEEKGQIERNRKSKRE